MSDGTPGPATWPRCRGPLAYGHATATRIFFGGVLSAYSFARSGRAHDHTNGHETRSRGGRQHEQREDWHGQASMPLGLMRSVVVPFAVSRLGGRTTGGHRVRRGRRKGRVRPGRTPCATEP